MITVTLADPGAFHAQTPLGDWFVSAGNRERLGKELEKPAFLALPAREQAERLGALADDGTVLYVPGDGSPLWLYRTINASRDLYFTRDNSGNWLFADHFRNLAASIPPNRRRLCRNALLDFLLFFFPVGNSTLLEGVFRLLPGECRSIDPGSGEERSRQAEILPCEPGCLTHSQAVTALEEALVSALGELVSNDCVLFSGGVDSTLVLLFRPVGSAALTVGIDSPEFGFELEYARETARMLDSKWKLVLLKEEDYRKQFEEAVFSLGQPFHPNFQPVLLNRAFQEPFDVFWGANASDTLFGHPQTRKILDPEKRKENEALLSHPFHDPEGYGALSNTGPDFRIIRDLFGEEAVSKRIETRLSQVLKSARVRPGDPVEEHVQVDSLIEFLTSTNAIASQKRQAAATFGSQTREPFFARSILRIAAAIPPRTRFFYNGEFKPVPKALLREKLPRYTFYGRKGGSDIPRTRFCQAGPFRDFFKEWPIPDLFPQKGENLLLDPQWDWSFLTLTAAAFSVWQEKVLKSESLCRVPRTRDFCLDSVLEKAGAPGE